MYLTTTELTVFFPIFWGKKSINRYISRYYNHKKKYPVKQQLVQNNTIKYRYHINM